MKLLLGNTHILDAELGNIMTLRLDEDKAKPLKVGDKIVYNPKRLARDFATNWYKEGPELDEVTLWLKQNATTLTRFMDSTLGLRLLDTYDKCREIEQHLTYLDIHSELVTSGLQLVPILYLPYKSGQCWVYVNPADISRLVQIVTVAGGQEVVPKFEPRYAAPWEEHTLGRELDKWLLTDYRVDHIERQLENRSLTLLRQLLSDDESTWNLRLVAESKVDDGIKQEWIEAIRNIDNGLGYAIYSLWQKMGDSVPIETVVQIIED